MSCDQPNLYCTAKEKLLMYGIQLEAKKPFQCYQQIKTSISPGLLNQIHYIWYCAIARMYAYHHKYVWKFMYFIEYVIGWTSQSCETLKQFFESLYLLGSMMLPTPP